MSENDVIVEAWNTVLFDKFCRFKHLLVDGLAPLSNAALDRADYPAGARVLDVGCGFGDSTRLIAQRVGAGGEAVGVDCAKNFTEAAAKDAAAAGVKNASFFVADVQTDDLRGPYDFAFSRFGTMFFMSPGAALRNVRKALKPGGTLTMIVWRKREENPWIHDAEQCVKAIVPVVSHEETNQVHCGPGPFSMASADLVSNLLQSARFDRVTFERCDADICVGKSLDDALEFAMALGPAGEILRLAGAEAERLRPQVVAALREALGKYERPEGVWGGASSWIVRARAA